MEPAFPRRIFLGRSLQLAGALLLAPLVPTLGRAGETAAEACCKPLAVFTEAELEIARAVAETLIPEGGANPAGGRSVDLARRLDTFLASEPEDLARGVRSALWAVEYGAPILAGRFGRLTRMRPHQREAYLAALPHRYPLARNIYAGLKQAFFFLFYSVDESWPATGYDGPWV